MFFMSSLAELGSQLYSGCCMHKLFHLKNPSHSESASAARYASLHVTSTAPSAFGDMTVDAAEVCWYMYVCLIIWNVCMRHSAPGADGINPALLLVMWACCVPGGRRQEASWVNGT